MEEDLRGYLDWITQAEDLDAEPTSGLGANNSNSKDNGTGNMTTSDLPIRKTSEVIWGVLKSSMVPMILHEQNGNSSEGIIDVARVELTSHQWQRRICLYCNPTLLLLILLMIWPIIQNNIYG